ncbi:hypothetical protein E2C01_088221 [Portunus trituberculatus]|uniref:Uncharacterized protein n=1 Tax=Portunus trituberculatus TaxID=210409 RepID=A0A5B7JA63_PORTR|nr:hypothetical protein [Portunus trituberculatus]
MALKRVPANRNQVPDVIMVKVTAALCSFRMAESSNEIVQFRGVGVTSSYVVAYQAETVLRASHKRKLQET